MTERAKVYIFRDGHFAPAGDTIVCAASRDVVVSVFGGGGLKGEAGLATAFGGSAVFRDEDTGLLYLGVWGSRNASRFRRALRDGGVASHIVRGPPPGRLIFFSTQDERPKREV
jgi:hypothetical protein